MRTALRSRRAGWVGGVAQGQQRQQGRQGPAPASPTPQQHPANSHTSTCTSLFLSAFLSFFLRTFLPPLDQPTLTISRLAPPKIRSRCFFCPSLHVYVRAQNTQQASAHSAGGGTRRLSRMLFERRRPARPCGSRARSRQCAVQPRRGAAAPGKPAAAGGGGTSSRLLRTPPLLIIEPNRFFKSPTAAGRALGAPARPPPQPIPT